MLLDNREILYRGWRIEPFAIPCADGNWEVSCEIKKLDGTSDDSASAFLENVVRKTKEDAIADACVHARNTIDSSWAVPCPSKTLR